MRRTKEQAAMTRDEILRVGQALFLEDGYESVTLERIATAAGVTRGAVSWHFGNREGLLYAIREEMRWPLERLAKLSSAGLLADPLNALSEAIVATFRNLEADPRQRNILRILFHLDTLEVLKGSEKGTQFNETLRVSLIRIFEAINRTSGLSFHWEPLTAAMTFSVLLRGLITEWVNRDNFVLIPTASDAAQTVLTSFIRSGGVI